MGELTADNPVATEMPARDTVAGGTVAGAAARAAEDTRAFSAADLRE